MSAQPRPSSQPRIPIDRDRIAAFCTKWKIVEFALFGSVLTDEFGPDSDVDVLVTFDPRAKRPGFDWVDMLEDLRSLMGREVDLVSKDSLTNPFRRRTILDSHEVVYRAA